VDTGAGSIPDVWCTGTRMGEESPPGNVGRLRMTVIPGQGLRENAVGQAGGLRWAHEPVVYLAAPATSPGALDERGSVRVVLARRLPPRKPALGR